MFYITAMKHFQCRSCKCRIDRGNIYYTSKHAHTHHQGNLMHNCKIEFDHRNLTAVLQRYPLTLKFSLMLNCDTVTVVDALFWKETVKFSPARG